MIEIKIKVEDKEVRELLGRLQTKMNNLTPAMKEIGQIVRDSVMKNFQVGGRPAWKPSKRALRQVGKTLMDTGRLYKSINAKAYNDRAVIGTNVKYAAIHQFGGKAGRGRKVSIIARPYLMVQNEDWREITAALLDYLMKAK